MNYLLDTHTLIWAITEKKRLSPLVLQILTNADHAIFVSAISFWEISLKYSIGKLAIQGVLPNELPALALKTGFQVITLSPAESATYHELITTNHRDPFDRMLIWQAIQRELIFITKDETLSRYSVAGLKAVW